MKNLIDFFESLKFDKIESNIEFSNEHEQVTITKGNNAYLFSFMKSSSIFRTNLCKEILLIMEDRADLKLGFNNQLADYLELKFQGKSVEEFKSKNIDCPKDFINQFEEELMNYPNFNYAYLSLAVEDKELEQKNIKKIKV